jgi:hypothetical protein
VELNADFSDDFGCLRRIIALFLKRGLCCIGDLAIWK